jgi:hypothetical protein
MGVLNNFDQMFGWAYEKCVPLVREITFENAEVSLFFLHQTCCVI